MTNIALYQRLAKAVVAGMEYNPGHSDLDDEQPVWVKMTLGDYRLACRLAQDTDHETR